MTFLQQATIFLLTAVSSSHFSGGCSWAPCSATRRGRATSVPGDWGQIADADATLNFAEIGVVLLLFLIGLELEPRACGRCDTGPDWVGRRSP
jgi:Kef-type K+ transport system membrane component KefB